MKKNMIALIAACLLVSITGSTLPNSVQLPKNSLVGTWLFNFQRETGFKSHGIITFCEDGTAICHDSGIATHGVWKKVGAEHFKALLTNVTSGEPEQRSKCEVDITIANTTGTVASGSIVQTFYPVHDLELSQPLDSPLTAKIVAVRLNIN